MGGIVVFNEGIITDCSVAGTVCGGKYLGGIAAVNSGTISNCTCNANLYYCFRVTDNDYMGGIAGYCQGGSITNCTFNGLIHIYVKDWDSRNYQPYIGGIAGFKESGAKITNCTFAGIFEIDCLNPDVSWWSWFVTHHFNQQENVKYLYNS